jgi:hypothetical protein
MKASPKAGLFYFKDSFFKIMTGMGAFSSSGKYPIYFPDGVYIHLINEWRKQNGNKRNRYKTYKIRRE